MVLMHCNDILQNSVCVCVLVCTMSAMMPMPNYNPFLPFMKNPTLRADGRTQTQYHSQINTK